MTNDENTNDDFHNPKTIGDGVVRDRVSTYHNRTPMTDKPSVTERFENFASDIIETKDRTERAQLAEARHNRAKRVKSGPQGATKRT